MRIIKDIVLSDYAEKTIYSGNRFTSFGSGIGFYFLLGTDHRNNISMFIYQEKWKDSSKEKIVDWYEKKTSTLITEICTGMIFILNDQKGKKEIFIHSNPYPFKHEHHVQNILEKAWIGYIVSFKENKGRRAPEDFNIPHGI
jgi:hypothetical protein